MNKETAKELKMKKQKKTQKTDTTRIVLKRNDYIPNGPCFFCGSSCQANGLDIVAGGHLVCVTCAQERALDLYNLRSEAFLWGEKRADQSYNEGRRSAYDEIRTAMDETALERIERLCRKNEAKEEKEEIPSMDIDF